MRFNNFTRTTIAIPLLIFSFVSCRRAIDSNGVVEFYLNPEFGKYRVETVALLPMAFDDTTSTGTFYSTNYFFNQLLEIPSINIVDIDKIVSTDSAAISDQIKSIIINKKFDLNQFQKSDLGKWLDGNNCNTIILGNVTDFKMFYYTWYSNYNQFMITTATVCNFNYFMVSLEDGSILWSANVDGEATYMDRLPISPDYPPLDEAISKGIDLLLEKLEKESILYKK
jgi:hypothetical protein